MAYWRRSSLSGYDSSPVALSGRLTGRRNRVWRFWDGTGMKYIPQVYIRRYRKLDKRYLEIIIPQWLVRRHRIYERVYTGKAKDQ